MRHESRFNPNFRLAKSWRLRSSRAKSSINVAVAVTELLSWVSVAAGLSKGWAVGVRIWICQSEEALFHRKEGTRPARTSEDLPLPDSPTIARKRITGREVLEAKTRTCSVNLAINV